MLKIILFIEEQFDIGDINIFIIMKSLTYLYLQNQFKNLKKTPSESKAETTLMMLPSDANPKGNVFGGVILKM